MNTTLSNVKIKVAKAVTEAEHNERVNNNKVLFSAMFVKGMK